MKSHSATSQTTLQQGLRENHREICFAGRVMIRYSDAWDTFDFSELLWFPLSCPRAKRFYLPASKKSTLFVLLVTACLTKALIIVLQNISNLCWLSTLTLLAEALHKTSKWKRLRAKPCCMWLLFLSHLEMTGLTLPRIPP